MIPFARSVAGRTYRKAVMAMFAQGGKSDTFLDLIGQRFDQAPTPTLYLGPTKQFLTEQWEPRIADLIDQSPVLAAKAASETRQTKTRKMISGVPLRLAHGGSSVALKSDPIGFGLTDESDELMANVKGAGDPIKLLDKRGETYADFVHAIVSTPSTGPSEVEIDPETGLHFWAELDPSEIESTIWRLWQSGTRYHWAWPCPECGDYFIPRFNLLKWDKPKRDDGKEAPSDPILAGKTAHLLCPVCSCEIYDESKEQMNARGVYVAPGQHVTPDGVVHGDPPDRLTVSFWASGLASPFKTWGDRAAEYVEAVRSHDHDEIQAVTNGSFGELYAPGSGEVPEWRELEALKPTDQPFVLGEVPEWVRFLTLACDVQKNSLIWGIRGWGPRATSCLIQIGELWGHTANEEVWEDLEEVLLDRYGGFPIRMGAIDSGFRPGNPKQVPENRVYSFCQRHSRLLRPTKGRDTLAGRPVRPSKIEARVNWRGKLETVGIELLHVDTDNFKRAVHERLRWPIDQPGAFLLPDDVPDFYLQQLVSEARVKKPGGKPQWVRRSKDNHFFDIEAMQAALGWLLGAQRIPDEARERRRREELQKSGLLQEGKKPTMADFSAALNR